MKINWDEPLPDCFKSKFLSWLKKLNLSETFELDRHYLSNFNLKDVTYIQLYGFSDASNKAYAAVVDIRFILKDGSYFINFVASKTKIVEGKKFDNSKT